VFESILACAQRRKDGKKKRTDLKSRSRLLVTQPS
jgi:hypothetical protein